MSVPMHTLHTHNIGRAFGTGLLCLSLLAVGCGPSRSASIPDSRIQVLSELGLGENADPIADIAWGSTQSPLSLVAGDTLAFRLAIAGGYFDLGTDAPVYANVEASGFE